MSAAKALSYLRECGVDVSLDDGDVVLVGVEVLSEEAIARLREIKADLVEQLRREAETALYDHHALQAEADRKNAEAMRAGLTDRFCACGRLAPTAWAGVWSCDECAETRGRA